MRKVRTAYGDAKIERLVAEEFAKRTTADSTKEPVDEETIRKEIAAEQSQVTTEDLVELTYWDDALAEKVHKHESRCSLIKEVI